MTTVRTILSDALSEIGVLDPTMTMDADMASHALRMLNRMLEAWSAEDLLVYTMDRLTFPLTIGTQDYTIGTGGTINTPRPVQIERASILLTSQNPTQPVEIPIPILNTQQWQNYSVKNISSQFPTAVWLTGDFPLQKAYFWPIPQSQVSVIFYQWGLLDTFTSVNDAVEFPRGYEEAIVSNLAVRLCPTYGKQIPQATAILAQSSKNRLRTLNEEPIYIGSDPALLGISNTMAIRSFGLVVDP